MIQWLAPALLGTLVLSLASYGILTLAVARRATRSSVDPPPPSGAWPSVSIIVPARNERETLERCAGALLAQDYPADRLEILLADDESTDGTAALIDRLAARAPRIRPLRTRRDGAALVGKARVLHEAVGASTGDIILTTDADCAPPPGWTRRLVSYFTADPSCGMVCGITRVEGETGLSLVQQMDWLWLMTSAAALAEMGAPVTAMGNNMGFRRAAYEAVGGFPALPFSVTEDYRLFQAIHRHADWSVRLPLDGGLENVTLPVDTFADVLGQRKRWARGGLSASGWIYGLYATLFLTHALLPAALLLAWLPVFGGGAAAGLLSVMLLGLKIGVDARLLHAAYGLFGRRFPARKLPAFQLYFFGYMILLPFALLLTPRVTWKERTF